jgi:hypothetical protein
MSGSGRFISPAFSECRDCKFFSRRTRNPICGPCTAGEFFEERIRIRSLDDHEAMTEFGRMTNER